MKSIQIILLLCIHIGDDFPNTMRMEDISVNLNVLLEMELIIHVWKKGSVFPTYMVTPKGDVLIDCIYQVFK